MTRREHFIAITISIVILLIGGILVFNHVHTNNQSSPLAEEVDKMAPYMPDYTKQELEDYLGSEVTEAQQKILDEELYKNTLPEVAEFIENKDPEDTSISYIDKSGNVVTMEEDEELASMTEEELSQYNKDKINSMVNNDDSSTTNNEADKKNEENEVEDNGPSIIEGEEENGLPVVKGVEPEKGTGEGSAFADSKGGYSVPAGLPPDFVIE